jgi:thiol-disulfide isomerase/thioredoxin
MKTLLFLLALFVRLFSNADNRIVPMKKAFGLGLSAWLLCSALLPVGAAVPDLPKEWRSPLPVQTGNGTPAYKMTLLDFYSQYCGTCQMMHPYVQELEGKIGDSVHFKHIDIGAPNFTQYIQSYQISGTPTYVLYDTNGKAVYRMSDRISAPVLEKQVMRVMHRLQPVQLPEDLPLPKPVEGRESAWSNLILLAFEKTDCETCQILLPHINGFEKAGAADGLHVIHMNADESNLQDAAQREHLKTLMSRLKVRTLPTYILLDNAQFAMHAPSNPHERGELFRAAGKVQPNSLWQVIRLFSQSGV